MPPLAISLILLWAGLCSWQDLRGQRISNRLTYPAILVALAWLLLFHHSIAGATPADAVCGGVLALAFGLPGHIRGYFGGGDVKLLAAIGIAAGASFLLYVVAVAALSLVVWVLLLPRLTAIRRPLQRLAPGLALGQKRLAYAPFIFIGIGVAMLIGG